MPFRYNSPNGGILRFAFRHHNVAFDGDNALDDRFVRVPRRYGHDDVTTFDGIQPYRHVRQKHEVHRFVRIERRLHGYTVNPGHGAEQVDHRVPDGHAEQHVFYATPDSHLTPEQLKFNANCDKKFDDGKMNVFKIVFFYTRTLEAYLPATH